MGQGSKGRGGFQAGGIEQVKRLVRSLVSLTRTGKHVRRVLTQILAIWCPNLTQASEEVVLISLNSQMRKPSLREVKQFASGHTATEWWGRLGREMGFKLTSDPKLLLSTKVLSRGTRSVSLAAAAGGSWSLGLF